MAGKITSARFSTAKLLTLNLNLRVSECTLDVKTGPFDYPELVAAAKQLKPRKACGVDQIPSEVFKDPAMLRMLLPIFNEIYESKKVPKEWLTNKLIVLPKKGDLSKRGSYRGITLMSCSAKLYNRMLLSRIRDPIEAILRGNQNGFRKSRSTLEPILALRRLIEGISAKKDKTLCAVFVVIESFRFHLQGTNVDHTQSLRYS